MTHPPRSLSAALSLLLATVAGAQPSRTPLTPGVVAITNVNVIPMTRDTVLRDMTVIVRDGRIATISRGGAIPSGAARIPGQGKYLIPGLADAHTHLYSDEYVADTLGKYEVGVMLANGITTARLMIGTPAQLALRADIKSGKVLGPQLWLASPQLTGRKTENALVVTTPDEARAAVKDVAAAGYDFVKLTEAIAPPVHDAIAEQAKASGIRVDGHVDVRVGVMHALEARQNIQHLDSYFEGALAETAPSQVSLTQGGVFRLQNWKSVDYLDYTKLARLAGATARSGIWSTPTLAIFNNAFGIGFTDADLASRADSKLMPRSFKALYDRARAQYWNPANDSVRTPARRKAYVDFRNRAAKAILDSGGKILAGSDSPDWFMVYGYTLHRELQALVTAGFTPFQALTSATRNPAEYFGAQAEWGTIEPGRRADLVLLSANPLDNISNTSLIEGVMVGGRWLPRAELDAMVKTAQALINDR